MNGMLHTQETFNIFLDVLDLHKAFDLPLVPLPEELYF